MPPRSYTAQPPLSQTQRMLQIASHASLSLSPHNQPHALLPTGNSVPLASETYYAWLSQELSEKGFTPAAPQLGHLIRQLDALAHTTQRYEEIHLRAVKTGDKTYKFDLNNSSSQVIELSPSGWKLQFDLDTRFYRPDTSHPYLFPDPVKPKLHHCLEQLFRLTPEKAKSLTHWMIQALLPGETPPALILTGKARIKAAERIRAIIDPVFNLIQAMPATSRQLGRLALSNRILAFSVSTKLSPNRLAALNEIREGSFVELPQVTRARDPLSAQVQCAIILSTAEPQTIHEGQLEIEINSANLLMDRSKMLTSLLTAAVFYLKDKEVTPIQILELESAAPFSSPSQDQDTQGPYP